MSVSIPLLFSQRNLSGPRLGFTYLPGNKELAKELKAHHMGSVLSQFGYAITRSLKQPSPIFPE
jgi:hypothetical protein